MDSLNPHWTVYGKAVDERRDEELLNDCFADLIDDTLTRGPDFLNFLLDGLIEFNEDAEIIATDRDPLLFREEGKNRRIDITVANTERIIGFESKRRDNLTRGQLSDELKKLKNNADGRDVLLIALTEHLSKPEIISQLSEDIRWVSWYAVAQRAFRADSLSTDWQPTVSRARKMFREFGYSEFSGVDREEFRVSVWELWKQTAALVEGLDTGERWPYRTLKTDRGSNHGWKPIDPDWMLLTFNREPDDTCYAILSNKRMKEVWVGLAVCPWKNQSLQNFMCDDAESLAERVIEEDLDVVQFPLNWLVGRKNLPEDHQKAVRADHPSSQTELVEAFSDRQGMENDGANRFVLGYTVSSSDELEESIEHIQRLKELFDSGEGPELQRLIQ